MLLLAFWMQFERGIILWMNWMSLKTRGSGHLIGLGFKNEMK